MTIDHLIPKSKGGPSTIDNFVPSCDKCNKLKGDLDPHIFMEVKNMEKHTLKAGTIVKVKGIPYQLCADARVYGENPVYNYPEDSKSEPLKDLADNQVDMPAEFSKVVDGTLFDLV